ncbi:MAG: hypothetical protein ACRYG8_15165 [Janthinobacterium lividum]
MMKGVACLSIALLAATPQRGVAAWLTAVKPLPDYKCAILNITDAQAHDQAFTVRAEQCGQSGHRAHPRDPPEGYLQVLAFSGTPGWIASSAVRPYAIPSQPGARCVPSLMSNGRVGFGH